ncbi:hypothetical protein SERLA73DRAFT_186111 [Serpula lacrymans var. lacrymans S7.3]|uniref:Uncharacterized protein n=2 Tax=Serpula lacrymans var. lacrymans TaxID=341189 RepID=F8Q6Z6_SERL3|nr:uncharacterized protein SERLADRAFT_474978 [Serpula lacrymans var. lacrymans S7.9]EGN96384.1 hypothetical protein SERLA73DRAFT_186111 [Serpula lacrymans var. lacrymans S7.3]EGO21921.1 hypothetical protein SERLADRAFT_474978 [Serpula lacrymans var. lacrymans S7.9]
MPWRLSINVLLNTSRQKSGNPYWRLRITGQSRTRRYTSSTILYGGRIVNSYTWMSDVYPLAVLMQKSSGECAEVSEEANV